MLEGGGEICPWKGVSPRHSFLSRQDVQLQDSVKGWGGGCCRSCGPLRQSWYAGLAGALQGGGTGPLRALQKPAGRSQRRLEARLFLSGNFSLVNSAVSFTSCRRAKEEYLAGRKSEWITGMRSFDFISIF